MKLRIYQLDIENPNSYVMIYRDWDRIKNVFNFNAYKQVYEDTEFIHINPLTNEPFQETTEKLLDHIFIMLNIGKKPEGYHGHSLSVSDIIELNGVRYYVDEFGFKMI